jgi:hypothetical protein
VAVPDFFALGPVPPVEGVVPEEFAADALANLLAKNAGTRRTALPREAVRRAESALEWKPSDALRFARLQALGRAVGADRLLIGWIQRLDLDQGGGGGTGAAGRHFLSAFAVITVQVFDVGQGRIVSQVQQSGYELGMSRAETTGRLLRHLLERSLSSLLPALYADGNPPTRPSR